MARQFMQPGARLDFSSLPITTGPLTFSLWFNRDAVVSSGTELLIGFASVAPPRGYALRLNGSLQVVAFQQDGFATSSAITGPSSVNGVWNHAAAVFSSTTARTSYLNGVSSPLDTTNVPFTISTLGAVGATTGGGSTFSGSVAEIGVWDTALTSSQIQQLAAGFSPAVVALPNLVGFYTVMRSGDNQSRTGPFSELNTTGTVPVVDGPPVYLTVV